MSTKEERFDLQQDENPIYYSQSMKRRKVDYPFEKKHHFTNYRLVRTSQEEGVKVIHNENMVQYPVWTSPKKRIRIAHTLTNEKNKENTTVNRAKIVRSKSTKTDDEIFFSCDECDN